MLGRGVTDKQVVEDDYRPRVEKRAERRTLSNQDRTRHNTNQGVGLDGGEKITQSFGSGSILKGAGPF